MGIRNYSNEARPLSLSSRAEADDDQIFVNAPGTGDYPEPPFLLAAERGTIREEIMLCTVKTTNSFTVSRGFDGTDPAIHESGSPVEHTVAAIDFREANQHVNNEEGHWLPGDMKMVAKAVTAGTEDAGWLLCDGRTVSQTTYQDLYGAIGTLYNIGAEGVGNFRLPDLRRAFPMGKAASGTGAVLGAQGVSGQGGSKDAVVITHSHTTAGNTNATGNAGGHGHNSDVVNQTGATGSHGHTVGVGDHDHATSKPDPGGSPVEVIKTVAGPFNTGSPTGGGPDNWVTFDTGHTSRTSANGGFSVGTGSNPGDHRHTIGLVGDHAHAIGTAGVAGTDLNLPPFQTFNYLIKT